MKPAHGLIALSDVNGTAVDQDILRDSYLLSRRVLEVMCILFFSPVAVSIAIIVAVSIKLTSKGSILFIQCRPGKNGQVFRMIKFRTMHMYASDDQLTQDNDVRVTKLGKHLRKYRIDEIPQLWNVLTGDMSIIGPRPVPCNFYEKYQVAIPNYDARHIIRPGITGLAQVVQGYTSTLEGEIEKLAYDIHYIQNLSPKLDLMILWNTFKCTFKSKGH